MIMPKLNIRKIIYVVTVIFFVTFLYATLLSVTNLGQKSDILGKFTHYLREEKQLMY